MISLAFSTKKTKTIPRFYLHSAWMEFTVALEWWMFTCRQLLDAALWLWGPIFTETSPTVCTVVSALVAGNETYLLFLLPACLLCWNQCFIVGAAFCCEVDLGQSVFYQRHRQIYTFNVQPANEVPRFVHALHFNFHLGHRRRRRK